MLDEINSVEKMFAVLVVLGLALNLVVAEDKSKHTDSETNVFNHALANSLVKNNVASHHNITYIEKAENLLRTPNINKYYEEHKKKKKPKKSPKRTIQKIIKKNRAKLRKVYFTKRINPTTSIPKEDYEKLYGQDEDKKWRDEQTTTQVNQRKKTKRKYTPKQSGYHHMPFQKLQKMDKRHKRGLSRELYILKDLDEMEFLSNEGDKDIVKTHVKKFW